MPCPLPPPFRQHHFSHMGQERMGYQQALPPLPCGGWVQEGLVGTNPLGQAADENKGNQVKTAGEEKEEQQASLQSSPPAPLPLSRPKYQPCAGQGMSSKFRAPVSTATPPPPTFLLPGWA